MTGQGHILVVDDEEMVRNFAATAIRSLGYAVTTAVDGCDAVEFYAQNWTNVDLVVLDLVMPNMNGEEAFHEMHRINPQVRAVASSGFFEDDDYTSFRNLGFINILPKPYSASVLSKIIHDSIHAPLA